MIFLIKYVRITLITDKEGMQWQRKEKADST